MNLSKILELQELNIEYNKIYNEFNNSDVSKKYNDIKEYRTKTKNALVEAVNQADALSKEVVEIGNKVKAVFDEAKELSDAEYDASISLDEMYDDKAAVEECKKSIQALLSKSDGEKSAIQLVLRKINSLVEEFTKVDAERTALKSKFDLLSEDARTKLDDVTQRIKKVKESMAESDAALYDNTKSIVGKAKAFVPLKGNNCGGCGMELDPSALGAIISDKIGQCPNCKRMVYISNEN